MKETDKPAARPERAFSCLRHVKTAPPWATMEFPINHRQGGRETMSTDQKSIAAADLADHYITIILNTKPEALVGVNPAVYSNSRHDAADFNAISAKAQSIVEFRQQLINGFQNQPLPSADE
ncbi:hypothetical protein E8K88_11820 [Lampropedia aestuarii]|uniref:Uncharacterized protein n=1 Tax=Lampropedia aestuarii TaxID=2562762 RepID=A0A4S5BIW7_9BURK|nr:hypothetical protein [Lampropedia aestuarii]THJ32384.1 hypothetical protein E8K88_11820 [Lampropedia aestuarii]